MRAPRLGLRGDGVGEPIDAFGETVNADQSRLGQRTDKAAARAPSESTGDGHGQLHGRAV